MSSYLGGQYKGQANICRKLKFLNYAKSTVMILKVVGILVYQGKHITNGREILRLLGAALINIKPCLQNPKLSISSDTVEKIIHLRRNYYLG
jgi:hypothetical protein